MLRSAFPVTLVLCLLFGSSAALSEAQAKLGKVLKAEGTVMFNGKAVKAGDPLDGAGTIKTGADGKAKIILNASKSLAYMNPGAELEIKDKTAVVTLGAGVARWVVEKVVAEQGKQPAKSLVVVTRTAAMGVRGTDFLTVVNPLLGETEIICFDGKVELASRAAKDDTVMVGKNQWGGIGGRFGAKIAPVLTLDATVMAYFNSLVPTAGE